MNSSDAAIRELIEKNGWAVLKIPEDDQNPGFAYTVGLTHSFGHPEILMSGLDLNHLHDILNDIGAQVRNGAAFAAGDRSDSVIEGYPVVFREIAREALGTYLGACVRFYGHAPFVALHCVWPDKDGLFPWDVGVADSTRLAQPALSNGPDAITFNKPTN